jgi:hypothetical protein
MQALIKRNQLERGVGTPPPLEVVFLIQHSMYAAKKSARAGHHEGLLRALTISANWASSAASMSDTAR